MTAFSWYLCLHSNAINEPFGYKTMTELSKRFCLKTSNITTSSFFLHLNIVALDIVIIVIIIITIIVVVVVVVVWCQK